MEQYFRDKSIPQEHQLVVASFTLDHPALTYYLEFVKICSPHTWLSFLNHLTTRVGNSFDTNSEAINQGFPVRPPSSSYQERSQGSSTGPLLTTYQELHQGSALAVVPRVSTSAITNTTLFRRFEDERWETVQRLKEACRKILREFIPLPQTRLEDIHSKPSPLLEEIKNIFNIVLASSNNFNIVLEDSVNLFDLSNNFDSLDNTSFGRFCLSEEIGKHIDQNNSRFLGHPEPSGFQNYLPSGIPLSLGVNQQLFPANSQVRRLPQGTLPRATSLSVEVVAQISSTFICEFRFGIFEENNFANLDLDSMLPKVTPTSTLSIHEESNWTIHIFDPGGFSKAFKFSFASVIQQQFLESSFVTDEKQFPTTIFIFDPEGCTISTIFQQIDTITFEMELQIVTTCGEDREIPKIMHSMASRQSCFYVRKEDIIE